MERIDNRIKVHEGLSVEEGCRKAVELAKATGKIITVAPFEHGLEARALMHELCTAFQPYDIAGSDIFEGPDWVVRVSGGDRPVCTPRAYGRATKHLRLWLLAIIDTDPERPGDAPGREE